MGTSTTGTKNLQFWEICELRFTTYEKSSFLHDVIIHVASVPQLQNKVEFCVRIDNLK